MITSRAIGLLVVARKAAVSSEQGAEEARTAFRSVDRLRMQAIAERYGTEMFPPNHLDR